MMERIISGVAGPMNDVNVYYPVTKQTNRLAEGYDQLIAGGYNALTAKLAEGLDIELNCVVTKIEDTGNKKVAIKCEGGSKYEADYVVCSLPLGVLKSDAVKFEPALPEDMSAKLGRLEMGGFEKVILVFDDHFYKGWKENMDEVCVCLGRYRHTSFCSARIHVPLSSVIYSMHSSRITS